MSFVKDSKKNLRRKITMSEKEKKQKETKELSRRKFFKTSLKAGAGIAVASAASTTGFAIDRVKLAEKIKRISAIRGNPFGWTESTPKYSIWSMMSGVIKGYPKAGFLGGMRPAEGVADFPVNYFLIVGGGRAILFDTGWDNQELLTAFNVEDWEPIQTQLARFDVKPEDVDAIVLSHMHWDHAGQVEHFPNAKVYVHKAEIDYVLWTYEQPAERTGKYLHVYLHVGYPKGDMDVVLSLAKKGRAVYVEGDYELAPGLRMIPALDTHTGGSQMLALNTAKGVFVLTGDSIFIRANIENWIPIGINWGSVVKQVLNYDLVRELVDGDFGRIGFPHDVGNYTDFPSWKWGSTTVGELVMAPGERSRKH
jgi:glyoxylase-like metal-dependent hydrolase (beta-lactamase superfamily II)